VIGTVFGVTDGLPQTFRTQNEIFLYDGSSVLRLTDNAAHDAMGDVNASGWVVWYGYEGGDAEIYLYDGLSTIQITDNDFQDRYPSINDNGWVAWHRDNGSHDQIFVYDGTTVTAVPDTSLYQGRPRINNSGWVVWDSYSGYPGNKEVYLFDGTNIVQLSDNEDRDVDPLIDDAGQAVWIAETGMYTRDLYLYDGTATAQIGEQLRLQYYELPPFDMSRTGWITWIEDMSHVFLDDGTGAVEIDTGSHDRFLPQVSSGGHVAWLVREPAYTSYALYLYDGAAQVQVGSIDSSLPRDQPFSVNGSGWVAWKNPGSAPEDEDLEIFLYDGTGTVQITDDEFEDNSPLLGDNGVVVWSGNRYYPCTDADGDGYGDPASPLCPHPELDCNDGDPDVHPGGVEGPLGDPTCSDGEDNDCDGARDQGEPICRECMDLDGDGYGTNESANCPHPEQDCDDADPDVHPGMSEILENCVDDDCNLDTPDRELFWSHRAFAAGVGPEVLDSGDLNGDGYTDLAVGGGVYSGNEYAGVEILLGRGDGSFGQGASYPIGGTGPGGMIRIAELNGDGNQDLLVQWVSDFNYHYEYAIYYMLLPGNGDGTFGDPQYIRVTQHMGFSDRPDWAVGLEDLNRDGFPDLVVIDKDLNVLAILGNGDGTFQDPQIVHAGGPEELSGGTVADLNGDGDPDLVLLAPYSDSVTVLLGHGDGTFELHGSYAAGDGPAAVVIEDLDGDGHVDAAVVNGTADTVSVLLGNGDGSLQAPVAYAAGDAPVSIAVGDLDGDGSPDLGLVTDVAIAHGYSVVGVMLNDGGGAFNCVVFYEGEMSPSAVSITDLNSDGLMDMAVTDSGSNKLLVYLNRAGPGPGWGAASVLGAGPWGGSNLLNLVLALLLPLWVVLYFRRRL